MKSLVDRLASYAAYHRDKRNIATHFVGIPMILVGTQAALARVGIGPVNAAVGATALVASPGVVDFTVETNHDGDQARHASAVLHAAELPRPPMLPGRAETGWPPWSRSRLPTPWADRAPARRWSATSGAPFACPISRRQFKRLSTNPSPAC